jgi:hypothetical protein
MKNHLEVTLSSFWPRPFFPFFASDVLLHSDGFSGDTICLSCCFIPSCQLRSLTQMKSMGSLEHQVPTDNLGREDCLRAIYNVISQTKELSVRQTRFRIRSWVSIGRFHLERLEITVCWLHLCLHNCIITCLGFLNLRTPSFCMWNICKSGRRYELKTYPLLQRLLRKHVGTNKKKISAPWKPYLLPSYHHWEEHTAYMNELSW